MMRRNAMGLRLNPQFATLVFSVVVSFGAVGVSAQTQVQVQEMDYSQTQNIDNTEVTQTEINQIEANQTEVNQVDVYQSNTEVTQDSYNRSVETNNSGNSNSGNAVMAVPQSLLESRPVVVTPAMRNNAVPVQVNSSSSSLANMGNLEVETQDNGLSDSSQRTVGLGESDLSAIESRSNKNGNGIQIFNLNNNKNDQDLKNSLDQDQKNKSGIKSAMLNNELESDYWNNNRSEELRRERRKREQLNETRLLEKIEEDRIHLEGSRANSIEGMKFGGPRQNNNEYSDPSRRDRRNDRDDRDDRYDDDRDDRDFSRRHRHNDLEKVEVVAVNVVPVNTGIAPVSTVSTTSTSSAFSSTQFKISPMAGYRWTPNNNSEFKSENRITAGFAVEGVIANVVGIEANYLYGRDDLKQRGYMYGGFGSSPYYYAPSHYGFVYSVRSRDTHEFNANAKLGWFVGTVRPYVLGGFGALYTGYNIDDSFTKAEAASIGWKRSSTHLVGNTGAGVDFGIANNLSLGVRMEYQHVFGKKSTYNPWDIVNIYGDSKNRVKALASLQLIF